MRRLWAFALGAALVGMIHPAARGTVSRPADVLAGRSPAPPGASPAPSNDPQVLLDRLWATRKGITARVSWTRQTALYLQERLDALDILAAQAAAGPVPAARLVLCSAIEPAFPLLLAAEPPALAPGPRALSPEQLGRLQRLTNELTAELRKTGVETDWLRKTERVLRGRVTALEEWAAHRGPAAPAPRREGPAAPGSARPGNAAGPASPRPSQGPAAPDGPAVSPQQRQLAALLNGFLGEAGRLAQDIATVEHGLAATERRLAALEARLQVHPRPLARPGTRPAPANAKTQQTAICFLTGNKAGAACPEVVQRPFYEWDVPDTCAAHQ